MQTPSMLKIGEFSRLSRVSVRMLRHYDKLRLIRPAHVDDDSGYRYYAPEQLAELNRLLALKDLGFSLEEIGRLMRGGLSPEQVVGMLKLRHAELRRELDEGQARLRRVETRLNEMDRQGEIASPYAVVLKRVEPVPVASVRATMPNYVDMTVLWEYMTPFLRGHGLSVDAGHVYVYHDPEYRDAEIDTELAVPVPEGIPSAGRVTVTVLPGLECAAATVHRGAVAEVYGAYAALGNWMGANGYRICGPNRLVVLHRAGPPRDHVTEVLWPVRPESVAAGGSKE
ncbi:MAG: MerR family transcriptional regulator [Akkermansiaceae bacterium]|nr:MerR family transcriptional regulator [Armatimonadota bacterium]